MLEIVLRVNPTKRDYSVINRTAQVIVAIIDLVVPNRAVREGKNGRLKCHVESEFKCDTDERQTDNS